MRVWYSGSWVLCGLLALAACGPAPTAGPPSQDNETTQPPASPVSEVSPGAGKARSMLDLLVTPRQQGPYAPRDECGDLSGARAFREALASAVEQRDPEAIAAMASEDVRLDFGGGAGRESLIAKLREHDGALIDELGELLRLGCAGSEGGGLTIPWYFQQNFGDVGKFRDSYSMMLVTGVDVPLLEAATAGAKVRERLSWHFVSLIGGLKPDAPFQHVESAAGNAGYLATDSLRSVLDYRLLATRQRDSWQITALVAGD